MSNHRFSFWPKYVGPIGFKPVFWLKTLGRTLCGTPNGDAQVIAKNDKGIIHVPDVAAIALVETVTVLKSWRAVQTQTPPFL